MNVVFVLRGDGDVAGVGRLLHKADIRCVAVSELPTRAESPTSELVAGYQRAIVVMSCGNRVHRCADVYVANRRRGLVIADIPRICVAESPV